MELGRIDYGLAADMQSLDQILHIVEMVGEEAA